MQNELIIEYGKTWFAGFSGYSSAQLTTLPRVVTETGYYTGADLTDDQQGSFLLDDYLDGTLLGSAATFIYELMDQQGLGVPQGTRRPVPERRLAQGLGHRHSTWPTILDPDPPRRAAPGSLSYAFPNGLLGPRPPPSEERHVRVGGLG